MAMESQVLEKVNTFFSHYPPRQYKKNQILIHAGDDPQFIYYITSGKVKKYALSYRGDEVIVNIFKSPAFFPMSYAMNHTPNEYFYEADADIEVRPAPADEVVKFVKDNPDVLYDLLARVYRGSDGLLGRVVHLMAGTAKSRVLYELLVECRRFGTKQTGGYTVELSEADIGARAGLSRETVSRELQKLRAEGLLSATERRVIVPSLGKLQEALSKTV